MIFWDAGDGSRLGLIPRCPNFLVDEKKGRFNGAFQVLSTSGALISELLAGVLTLYMDQRAVLLLFEMLSVVAALVIIGGNSSQVKKIYNRDM